MPLRMGEMFPRYVRGNNAHFLSSQMLYFLLFVLFTPHLGSIGDLLALIIFEVKSHIWPPFSRPDKTLILPFFLDVSFNFCLFQEPIPPRRTRRIRELFPNRENVRLRRFRRQRPLPDRLTLKIRREHSDEEGPIFSGKWKAKARDKRRGTNSTSGHRRPQSKLIPDFLLGKPHFFKALQKKSIRSKDALQIWKRTNSQT